VHFIRLCTTHQQCDIFHIVFEGCSIPLSSSVRDLGIIIDSSLNFKSHISKVRTNSFLALRLVSRLKSSISSCHYSLLVNSLVLSNIHFCVSLYLGLPANTLNTLREVLHAAFRSVHKLRKFDHISELYYEKGWLTIEQLVKLRAASIGFKAREFGKPEYISQCINDRECERNPRVLTLEVLLVPVHFPSVNQLYGIHFTTLFGCQFA
jgi:hypothetical protein